MARYCLWIKWPNLCKILAMISIAQKTQQKEIMPLPNTAQEAFAGTQRRRKSIDLQ